MSTDRDSPSGHTQPLTDCILNTDARDLPIPDNSIDMVITSPPYNVGIDYDQTDDNLTLDEWKNLIRDAMTEAYRVLKPDGRLAINLPAGTGQSPYTPIDHYADKIIHNIGFQCRGKHIWFKGVSGARSTAFGTWKSAQNPAIRPNHEPVYVYSKSDWSKQTERPDTISKEMFLKATESVWELPAVPSGSKLRDQHPAPMPEELPRRLIELYSHQNDIVLDPFCGIGTVCLSAKKTDRRYIGTDISQKYVDTAKERLQDY